MELQSVRKTPWECNGQIWGAGNVVWPKAWRTSGSAIHPAQPITSQSDNAEALWFPQFCSKKPLHTLIGEGWVYFSAEDQGNSRMATSQGQEKALSKGEKMKIAVSSVFYTGARWQTGRSQPSSTDELAGAKSEPKNKQKSPLTVTLGNKIILIFFLTTKYLHVRKEGQLKGLACGVGSS